jgi:hypothetical protein
LKKGQVDSSSEALQFDIFRSREPAKTLVRALPPDSFSALIKLLRIHLLAYFGFINTTSPFAANDRVHLKKTYQKLVSVADGPWKCLSGSQRTGGVSCALMT